MTRLSAWSKLAPFIACWQGSEVMPGKRRVSEACRDKRIQPRRLRASRRSRLVLSVFRCSRSNTDQPLHTWSQRQYRGRRFHVRREVELVKFGYSDVCEGCLVAQLGAEAKPHREARRERIRQAMMSDNVGQQRLHAAEQRLAPAGG